tara:strand:+ start:74 stop:1522 length:1449 start_codon:yes stop_codon:yes gene_type:complete
MKTQPIVPIILAGGSGSRLWPLSRKSYPKQFLSLVEGDKNTLLQRTYKRIKNLENLSNPIIICNEEHRFIVGDQMRKIKINPLSIILEPLGRNTAPAIAIAALKAIDYFKDGDLDPILLILSSDHHIENINKFHNSLIKSIEESKKGNLIIFGVVPTYPATGYGYIESKDPPISENIIARKVKSFIEKPTQETAKLLFESNKFLWNSGMFVFKATDIIEEIESHSPYIIENCKESLKNSIKDLDFLRLDRKTFEKCPDTSIDIAVFEKTKKAFVIPLDCGWDDIGNWESIWNLSKKDKNDNSLNGKVVTHDTIKSLIKSETRLVLTIGLENIIIIDTKDALLVANKKNAQDVKKLVQTLNREGYIEGKQHKLMHRPWGHYLSIEEGSNWQIKKIEVYPGESLSLQMHHHRSEHWIVVQGTARVEIDNQIKIISQNESAYIPLGSKHRLSNPGKMHLILIEVQSGDYLGEDDIIRFEDIYGRN